MIRFEQVVGRARLDFRGRPVVRCHAVAVSGVRSFRTRLARARAPHVIAHAIFAPPAQNRNSFSSFKPCGPPKTSHALSASSSCAKSPFKLSFFQFRIRAAGPRTPSPCCALNNNNIIVFRNQPNGGGGGDDVHHAITRRPILRSRARLCFVHCAA